MQDGPLKPPNQSKPWLKMVGLGMELAASTLVMTGIGAWIDSVRQHETPYGAAAGALIGFVMGMTRFVIHASRSGPK